MTSLERLARAFAPAEPGTTAPTATEHGEGLVPPARLALGLASLAAERLRVGDRADETLAVAAGLMERAAQRSRALARQWRSMPSWRVARLGARAAVDVPGLDRLRGRADQVRDRIARITKDARSQGNITVAAGRDDALALIKSTVDDGIARLLDSMVPPLINDVMPKVIVGALPDIRAHVVPMLVDELANEPRVREMIAEQSRTAVEEAVEEAVERLRERTGAAG